MANEIDGALGGGLDSFWLCGSIVLGDYRPGWSDIDMLALADNPLSAAQAERLLMLRQTLSEQFGDPLFRCFEGVIIGRDEYLGGSMTRLVYWGTSGQRIAHMMNGDVFARFVLAKHGKAVYGPDDRSIFLLPSRSELVSGVREHCTALRCAAAETGESLYSCGWLLDIARGIYTLRFNDVVSKTKAGEWALREHIFPDEEALKRALMIRRAPLRYRDDAETRLWLGGLEPTVQRYADVLERELDKYSV